MRKSGKCEYTIGVNTRKKKKYLKPEDALEEARRVNEMPQTIKKVIAYKCTTCNFFHLGRTQEDLDKPILSDIVPEPVIEKIVQVKQQLHDDFDWETDKRIL